MEKNNLVSLFGDEFIVNEKKFYDRFKLKSDYEMFKFLKQFIIVEESQKTPYKHKDGFYNKKGHYINGKKVNNQVYKYVKAWLDSDI